MSGELIKEGDICYPVRAKYYDEEGAEKYYNLEITESSIGDHCIALGETLQGLCGADMDEETKQLLSDNDAMLMFLKRILFDMKGKKPDGETKEAKQ